MSRCLSVVVAVLLLTATAYGGAPDARPQPLSVVSLATKPVVDATAHVNVAKRATTTRAMRCRLTRQAVAMPETGGQYTVHPIPDDTAVSLTLIHPLSTPTWVTPLARELAQTDDDTIDPSDVDISLLLANGGSIEFEDVGLEVELPDDGVVRATTRVRLPRRGIDALASSPVVQIEWTVNGTRFPSSLSRHQGQRWYQEPFACIAAGML